MNKRLLVFKNTTLSMSDVIERIGYGDESTFRRLFKRHTTRRATIDAASVCIRYEGMDLSISRFSSNGVVLAERA